MKKIMVVIAALVLTCAVSPAQFKSQVAQENQVSVNKMGDSSPLSYLFGWFNPDKFFMHHSFDMSYTTFSGQGLSLGTYTNSMMYQFADNFNAKAEIAFSFSPYSSLAQFNKNDLSRIYLKNAELNYKPSDNTSISLSFRQNPYGYYNGYNNGYYSPLYSPFSRDMGF